MDFISGEAMSNPKPKKKLGPYYQVTDGEWVEIPWKGFKEMCCGCGLIHKVDYRVMEGKLQFRCVVDPRATNAARRPFKFTKEDDE
jgi:hypothetical protein